MTKPTKGTVSSKYRLGPLHSLEESFVCVFNVCCVQQ